MPFLRILAPSPERVFCCFKGNVPTLSQIGKGQLNGVVRNYAYSLQRPTSGRGVNSCAPTKCAAISQLLAPTVEDTAAGLSPDYHSAMMFLHRRGKYFRSTCRNLVNQNDDLTLVNLV